MRDSPSFRPTGNPEADALLQSNPLALLLGMLLDQQVPIEFAFAGPLRLAQRMGDGFSVGHIASRDPEELLAYFLQRPAVHRYPAAMARRFHALCVALHDRYGEDPAQLWSEAKDATSLLDTVRSLPGFAEEKSRIFVAVLGKRFGVQPPGWVAACAPFGDDQPRTAADIDSPTSQKRVKEWKAAQRAAGKSKAD